METYLERYQRPRQTRTVWAELVSRGAAIRVEPLYSQARAVVDAMMQRARHNVDLLVPRLHHFGYRFVDPERVWIQPDPATLHALDDLERDYGPVPLVLRVWFEVVGSVNFMGAHPRLSSNADLDWGGSERMDGDPLVVDSIFLTELGAEPYADAGDDAVSALGFAPDVAFKAHESGGGSMSLLVPNPAFDGPVIDPGERWTGTFFIHHLQTCFEWGGFPGLRGNWYPGQESGAAASQAELDFLRQDLLPIL